jgi:hypothetical protein
MANKCSRKHENLTEVSDLNGVARLCPLLKFEGRIAKIKNAMATLQKPPYFSGNFVKSPIQFDILQFLSIID